MVELGMSLYGKHFASMYEGSMVGKGAIVFALMGYVIANMRCQWVGIGRAKQVTEGLVTLNAKLLAAVLGESESAVKSGIDFLTSPDAESRTKDEEGRRLVKVGEFEYRVVNAPYYQGLKDKEDERKKNRDRQQKYREAHGLASGSVVLVGKDAEEYQAARGKSWQKRRKVAQVAGIKDGAQEAIRAGLTPTA